MQTKITTKASRPAATAPVQVRVGAWNSPDRDVIHRIVGTAPAGMVGPSTDDGAPLPSVLGDRLGRAFGADISGVRVHTDEAAAASTEAVSARAFTSGKDIYFARNLYDPANPLGQRLIAHEVAHTQQQPSGSPVGSALSTRGDRAEREADAAAAAFVVGTALPSLSPAPAGMLLREAQSSGAAPAPTRLEDTTITEEEAAALALFKQINSPRPASPDGRSQAADSDAVLLQRLRQEPPMSRADFEAALVIATLRVAILRASLLPQAYLRDALGMLRPNPNIRAALVQAASLAAYGDLIQQLSLAADLAPDLLSLVEREYITDPASSTFDLLEPRRRDLYKKTRFVKNDYPGSKVPGPNSDLARRLAKDFNDLRPARRANDGDTAVLSKSRFIRLDSRRGKYKGLDRDIAVITSDGHATPGREPRDDIDIDYVIAHRIVEEIPPFAPLDGLILPRQDKGKRIHYTALESFLGMREAARRDGVSLVVLAGHDPYARRKTRAAAKGNSAALASYSSHTLGLAVDLATSFTSQAYVERAPRGGKGDPIIETRRVRQDYKEISTDMSNVVAMRNSPVHKWMLLHGVEYGWYAYHNEPWHWEYNPPGFRVAYLASLSLPDDAADASGH